MATDLYGGLDLSFKAAADLKLKQFFCMELTAEKTVNLANAVTDRIIGILQNKPDTNQAASVRHLGISKAVAGAAITVNSYLASDAAGKVVANTTVDRPIAGIALTAAAADGDVIDILLPGPAGFFRTAA